MEAAEKFDVASWSKIKNSGAFLQGDCDLPVLLHTLMGEGKAKGKAKGKAEVKIKVKLKVKLKVRLKVKLKVKLTL
jgi:hypothetical protein